MDWIPWVMLPTVGGAIGWADPDARLAVAILKNRMLGPLSPEENPLVELADEVRRVLAVPG